jgi:hypothetical protein
LDNYRANAKEAKPFNLGLLALQLESCNGINKLQAVCVIGIRRLVVFLNCKEVDTLDASNNDINDVQVILGGKAK